MRRTAGFALVLLMTVCGFAQSDLDRMIDAEKAFDKAAAESGMKPAFLAYLSDDSIIFKPNAVNGIEFWRNAADVSAALLIRHPSFADIAANGTLGYTSGRWEYYPKGNIDPSPQFGQFVTIWERKQSGAFRAVLDIGVTHDKPENPETQRDVKIDRDRDPNKRGRSAVDASMNFLRKSMTNSALSGAYDEFAAEDIRVLLDSEPPVTGKKNVVNATRNYRSVDFPKKVALFEAADMAYTWNPCEYDNTDEGQRKGNCLHVWKLRNKKWWIVLGVFASLPNETQPKLLVKPKRKRSV
ncbi:MAG: hypothetical protein ACR2IH_08875 [Pyrinomonadaceae bacterium]